jgi:hypothetical protein
MSSMSGPRGRCLGKQHSADNFEQWDRLDSDALSSFTREDGALTAEVEDWLRRLPLGTGRHVATVEQLIRDRLEAHEQETGALRARVHRWCAT